MASVSSAQAFAQTKHSFSRQHLAASRLYADLAKTLEDAFATQAAPEKEKSIHRAHVTSTVIFSVAFLESSINELYLEACDKNTNSLAGMTAQNMEILAEMWATIEKAPVLTKYQMALVLCGKSRLDKGADPMQSAESAVNIRNALIHYRPEWDTELDVHQRIRSRVSGRFPENSLAEPNSLWFPHRCLGAGCAKWSVETVVALMTAFCNGLGIPSRI